MFFSNPEAAAGWRRGTNLTACISVGSSGRQLPGNGTQCLGILRSSACLLRGIPTNIGWWSSRPGPSGSYSSELPQLGGKWRMCRQALVLHWRRSLGAAELNMKACFSLHRTAEVLKEVVSVMET